MQPLEPLATPAVYLTLAGVVGLIVGSFLNVVVHRLPLMMRRSWRQDCAEYLGLDPAPHLEGLPAPPFNLLWPPSHCPHCQARVKAWQNLPVLSYLLLKGRCAACHAAISWRYPAIEALTAALSVAVAWRFGFGAQTVFALLLTWALVALSGIDIDHLLLPDSITLPFLWLGLLLSLGGWFTDPQASIIGAVAGYLSLWLVYHGFKLATGKEGMGEGDFKLLALFGAWLGWQYLPQIILLASLVGAVCGVAMIAVGGQQRGKPIPFGPYLAAAGWLALLWGKSINEFYLGGGGF